MRLIVPSTPLPFDQPVPLRVEGCSPLDVVDLRTRLNDRQGRPWEAWARFAAQADGTVDPGRDAPLEASYFGFDPVGMLWSMAPLDPQSEPFELEPGPARMQVIASSPHQEPCRAEVTRLAGQPGEPFGPGELFRGQAGRGAVLLLASQGLPREGAAMLAQHGLTSWALALPPRPVPLEWLSDQLAELARDHQRVTVCATGRAGEYALLAATRRPKLDALAICSGSGLAFADSWLGVPGIQVDFTQVKRLQREAYEAAVADRDQRDRGRIPVEKIEAPLLLMSGQQDGYWPSSAFSELAMQRLRKLGQEFPAEHLTFEQAGHLLGPERGVPHRPTGFLADLGGRPAHQAQAQRACWEKLLSFFNAAG
ncbi:MAG: hypothetical protein AMXMBFR33_69880 [Candidatus Xenobia bacterium]